MGYKYPQVLLKRVSSVLKLFFSFIWKKKKGGKKEHSGGSRVLLELSLKEMNTRGIRHKMFENKCTLYASARLYIFCLKINKRGTGNTYWQKQEQSCMMENGDRFGKVWV